MLLLFFVAMFFSWFFVLSENDLRGDDSLIASNGLRVGGSNDSSSGRDSSSSEAEKATAGDVDISRTE